jgi:hypothetical protein
VWKFSSNLEVLDEISMPGTADNQLNVPTSLSNAGGYYPTGGMMFTEAWTEQTGIKGFIIGIDVKDEYANSYPAGASCRADLSFRLTDVSDTLRVRVRKASGELVKTVFSNSQVIAGHHTFTWDGRNAGGAFQPAGAYFFEVYAKSNYRNPGTGAYSATVSDTVHFTHCGAPCTWKGGFTGALPDLFREGQGVIAQGRLEPNGQFRASNVLAKHDETYMPREVVKTLKAQQQWRGESGGQ